MAKGSMSVDELRKVAADLGFELRKRGLPRQYVVKKDDKGNVLRNAFMPHLRITATCYARTWKMLVTAAEAFDVKQDAMGELWETKLLLCLEHVVRYAKHGCGDTEMMHAITRLVNPLPKSEYRRKGKKAKK